MHIPFNRPSVGLREIERVVESFQSGHISGGGVFTKLAESKLERIIGSNRVLLTTSCTHALELASDLVNFRPGDEVVVPAYTFPTTASAFVRSGAQPIFADVDADTLNLSIEAVEAAVSKNTRAVCVVHYAGIANRLDELQALCRSHGLVLIEDNAHGLGGSYNGVPLGSWGQTSTLSFHETKNITCGEGGALCINDTVLESRAEILREKGTDRSRFFRGEVDKYTWLDLGSSWVLADLLSAVLSAQLERFDEIQQRRKMIWDTYAVNLDRWSSERGIRMPGVPIASAHPAHLFYLQFSTLENRDDFIHHMKERDITTTFHYQALNSSPMGIDLGGSVGQCPVSEHAANTVVRLPLYESMSDSDVKRVVDAAVDFKC